MGLRDIGETLPPGFRFYPSDEELVCHYLYKKIANEEVVRGTLVEIDLHVCEPWQLPDVAKLNSNEWYFFSFRDRKYATGFRTNRATASGYWKATGKDRVVMNPRTRSIVGMRKTLVFYRNRAPNGIKTGWIMHEFRLENPHVPPKEDWVLCRVFHKSRSGENSSNKLLMGSLDDYCHESASTCPTNVSAIANSPPNNQHDNNMASCGYQATNITTSLGLFPVEPAPYLPLSMSTSMPMPDHHSKINNMGCSQTKCEDDYGFMFDFDGSDNGVPSSLDDMGFDDDDGSVFV